MEGSKTSLDEQCTSFGRRRRYHLILCVTVQLPCQFVGTCQVQLPLAEAVTVKAQHKESTYGFNSCSILATVEMQVLQYAVVQLVVIRVPRTRSALRVTRYKSRSDSHAQGFEVSIGFIMFLWWVYILCASVAGKVPHLARLQGRLTMAP